MMYNDYEITMLNKNDQKLYVIRCSGSTLEEAIQHANYWQGKGEIIGEDFEVVESIIERTSDEYPYDTEDIMKKALANKAETIRKLENSRASARDKADLREVIENEAVSKFWYLDTACRDWLWAIME